MSSVQKKSINSLDFIVMNKWYQVFAISQDFICFAVYEYKGGGGEYTKNVYYKL